MDRHPTPRSVSVLLVSLLLASFTLQAWYASHGLHRGRYWDERISFENVHALLTTGSLRPANGFYQSLSYLPQTALLAATAALHRWTGLEGLAVYEASGRFSATSYLVARLLQALYGAGCLALTFLVARSLASPGVGLLAAFLLAVTPWHVHAGSVFKPDVLLVMAVLLTLWWTLRARDRPSLTRYALAGIGVALAMSSKLTGAVAAVPVVVAALASEDGWRRRGARLLAAGGTAAALFLVLNPYVSVYRASLAWNLEHYAGRAEDYGETHLGVLRREVELVASPSVHGPVVGFLALAGGVWFSGRLLRRGGRGTPSALEGSVFLSFPLAYSVVYAAFTPHFKDNNFLPVFPFTAFLAAWALVGLWRLAGERAPVLRRPQALAAAGTVLVLVLAPVPFLFAYRQVVPTTEELAHAFLRRRFEARDISTARWVYTEGWSRGRERSVVVPPLHEDGVAVVPVASLEGVDPSRLDAADGAVFPGARLEGDGSELYWSRLLAVPPDSVHRVESRPFRARGPERIAVAHPWERSAPAAALASLRPVAEERAWTVRLPPEVAPGEAVSIEVAGTGLGWSPRLESGARSVPLWYVSGAGGERRFLSARMLPGAVSGGLRLVPGPRAVGEVRAEVCLHRWSAPEPGE